MTIRKNSFEGGTDGGAITTANSAAGGDPFSFDADSGITYSTLRAAHRSVSARSVAGRTYYSLSGSGTRWVRMCVYRATTWAGDVVLAVSNTATAAWSLQMNGSNVTLRFGGVSPTTIATVSAAPASAAWIRLEAQLSTTGEGELRLYNDLDGLTPSGSVSGTASSFAAWDAAGYGTDGATAVWIDDVAWSDEGWLGSALEPTIPRIQPPPPTAAQRASRW